MTTQVGLLEYLRKIGFRKFEIKEDWGTVVIVVSGFGRFWRPRKKERAEIQARKPAFLSLTLTQRAFSFQLWEIKL